MEVGAFADGRNSWSVTTVFAVGGRWCWSRGRGVTDSRVAPLFLERMQQNAGPRIIVDDVPSNPAAGMSEAEILADFPDLKHEDFLAVFAFAADRERGLMVNAVV